MMMYEHPYGWVNLGIWGFLNVILFWVLLVIAIIFLVRYWALHGSYPSSTPRPGPEDTPLQIAQKRYARGDISREEYDTIRKDLAA